MNCFEREERGKTDFHCWILGLFFAYELNVYSHWGMFYLKVYKQDLGSAPLNSVSSSDNIIFHNFIAVISCQVLYFIYT